MLSRHLYSLKRSTETSAEGIREDSVGGRSSFWLTAVVALCLRRLSEAHYWKLSVEELWRDRETDTHTHTTVKEIFVTTVTPSTGPSRSFLLAQTMCCTCMANALP